MPELTKAKGDAAPRVERFFRLVEQTAAPMTTALTLLRSLRRKFPSARGEELIASTEQLFRCWARFDDWMGAVSLLRAVPLQRSYRLAAFATDMTKWLQSQDELFDALRVLTHTEGGGRLSLNEALAWLNTDRDGEGDRQATAGSQPAAGKQGMT